MTEKIIVSPQRVRCLGDVVSPKAVSDFDKVSCTLSSSSDTVYGTVYSESYLTGSTLSLVYDGLIGSDVDSFSVSATLKDSGGSAISSVSVYLSLNGVVTSATTNGSGVATFNVSTVEGATEYLFKVYYTGTGSVCGSYAYGCVRVGDVTGLTVNGSPSVIQSGDKSNIWAKLTGTGNLQGALVKFYEDWTPSIRLSGDKSVIQSGDSVDFTAQLYDSDGSLVRESGHSIGFYQSPNSDGVLFNDPTEHTLTYEADNNVAKIGAGVFKGLGNFILSFDFKATGEARFFIGRDSLVVPSNPEYCIFMGRNESNRWVYGSRSTTSSGFPFTGTADSTYQSMKIVRSGNVWECYLGETGKALYPNFSFGNYDDYTLGLVVWGTGCSVSVKNVKLIIGR